MALVMNPVPPRSNDDKDKKNLVKIIGAGVALVVVVVGGYRWQQARLPSP